MDLQSAENFLACRPWSEECMVWIAKRSGENSGVYSVYKKQMNLAPWWPQMEPQGAEKSIGLWNLVQCIFGVNVKKIGWKLRSLEHPQEKRICPPSGHKWNHRGPKISWHLNLGARNMQPKFEKDRIKTAGCRAHTRNLCSGSIMMTMHSIPDFLSGIQ